MRHDDRRTRSGAIAGPIGPGSVLHRVLVMVAQEIARSRAQGLPGSIPPADSPEPVPLQGQTPEAGRPRDG